MDTEQRLLRKFLAYVKNEDPWVVLSTLRAAAAIVETRLEKEYQGKPKPTETWSPNVEKFRKRFG